MQVFPRIIMILSVLMVVTMAQRCAVAQKAPSRMELSSDRRLSAPFTIPDKQMRLPNLFPLIRRTSGVRVYAGQGELQKAKFILGCDDKVAGVMDALAALWLLRWQKDANRNYELITSLHEYSVYLPDNEIEERRFEAGLPFISRFNRSPPEVRAGFSSEQAFPISSLPSEMRDAVQKMAATVNESDRLKGDENPFPLEKLNQSSFQLRVGRPGNFSEFFLTLSLPGWGSMGWSFNDYQKEKPSYKSRAGAENRRDAFVPLKHEIPLQEARRQPQLQRKVSLEAKRIFLSQAMRKLHKAYGISFICDAPLPASALGNVSFRNLPLADALDALTKIYPGAEWEYRKSGFIVVRDPLNPACQIKSQTFAEPSQ